MVAGSTTKRSGAKLAPGAKSREKVAPRSHHATHPPWVDMITECITTTPDGARHGVSRPTIKKFVDSKYHLPMNAAAASQLNRAITHGADKGNFVLPKGPSGKIKLAPKKTSEAAKENTKPASKRSTTAKEHVPPAKPTVKKPARAASKAKIATGGAAAPKAAPNVKKYVSTAKKARATRSAGGRTRGGRTAPGRRGIKRAVTGETAAANSQRAAGAKRKKASITGPLKGRKRSATK